MTVPPSQPTSGQTREDAAISPIQIALWCLNPGHPMRQRAQVELDRLSDLETKLTHTLVALGEPCADCGHVDWRADDERIDAYYSRLSALEGENDALKERIAELEREVMYRWSEDEYFKALRRVEAEREMANERVSALEGERDRLNERDGWMLRQIDGLIEEAEAVSAACGLALSRAVVLNLKDLRAALAAAGEER